MLKDFSEITWIKYISIYRLTYTVEGRQLLVKSKVRTFRDILKYKKSYDDGIFRRPSKM